MGRRRSSCGNEILREAKSIPWSLSICVSRCCTQCLPSCVNGNTSHSNQFALREYTQRSVRSQRIARPARPRGLPLWLLVAWFAHSHSASQFLRHLPSHWNSDIRPPHCGQTKLIIDEMICAFDSPGSVSKVLRVNLLSKYLERKIRGVAQRPQRRR